MRGEHCRRVPFSLLAPGSSPHARGARYPRWCWTTALRLIPACAGSTSGRGATLRAFQAHPRMRGEHPAFRAPSIRMRGSSPHARGAHVPVVDGGPVLGLIPACAGSTAPATHALERRGAHPRMRGEHAIDDPDSGIAFGSSPHARGAQHRTEGSLEEVRLIPACAGSTLDLWAGQARATAHPRMRGEHMDSHTFPSVVTGSSPHARGALSSAPPDFKVPGLIPACAGSTCAAWTSPPGTPAHPRMRGEHNTGPRVRSRKFGSSPHARGARNPPHGARRPEGLIPACAGSTAPHWTPCCLRTAHPRMRGEHIRWNNGSARAEGSSPHARGAPCPSHPLRCGGWLIPACAGSTTL